jgi:diguanylate cyclase (GGDEF)-like protein
VADEHQSSVVLVEELDADADRFNAILEDTAPAMFKVVRMTTLADASTYLNTISPDCVIVDLSLPDAQGLEIVETLAARAPALIVLTARDDDELGVAAIKAGASDYLPKSGLEHKQLVRSIRYSILRKRSENSLAEAQTVAGVGSWDIDLATFDTSWSRELYRLLHLALDEKPSFDALLDRVHPDDRQSFLEELRVTQATSIPFVIDHRVLLPDRIVIWVRARGHVELDDSGEPNRFHGTVQDITQQKTAVEAVLHQALHDPLSGLPNRQLFLERLADALKRLTSHPATIGVIYLNIDRFKVVNDSLGHEAGDHVLLAMATRLRDLMRPGDTLARVGGDEFVVLCEDLSGEEEAVRIADSICMAVADPLAWDRGDLVLSVGAGIAVSASASDSPHSLLRNADAAMYRAKDIGQGRSAVFTETMRTNAVGRLTTEISLRQSITDGDMQVFYQPIVTLADGQIIGHEALVRWFHPTKGLIGPDQFISIAEETGLIVPLGAWVLREACQQAKRFQDRDPMWSHLTMSVNLSGGQLGQPDLIELVSSALHDADLRPGYLQLEMTESVLMDDAATTITILKALKGLGVRLGVDDFGTGFSSLAYLRRFPVDVLKIDRSFVNGLGRDLEDSAVAAAVASLADTLGLTTVAEGVETRLQRDCLIGLGCSRAQGYLFSRPVDASECEAALDRASKDDPIVSGISDPATSSIGPR